MIRNKNAVMDLKTCSLFSILLLAFNVACQEQKPKPTLWTVAWSMDGKFIAAGGNQDELKLFDAHTFDLVKTYPIKNVQLSRIKWHPFKNMLALITQSGTIKAKILNLDTNTWIELDGLASSFRALDWNYNGEFLAVSELKDAVSIYTVAGKRVSRFLADPKSVTGIDWHPNKNILTTVGSQIGIYNHMGEPINRFQPRTKEVVLLCVAWHTSGDFFVVGDYGDLENAENKLLQFWSSDGVKQHEIKGSIAEYRNLRWNPNGEKLATASDALRLWTKDGKLLAESTSTNDYLWGVDWSPDGEFIVTSSSKGEIIIWDKNANFVREVTYK